MSELELLLKLWPVFLLLLAGFAWLIRLEAKVMYLEKDHDENKKSMWEKIKTIELMLLKISESLARIEGKIDRD